MISSSFCLLNSETCSLQFLSDQQSKTGRYFDTEKYQIFTFEELELAGFFNFFIYMFLLHRRLH